MLVVSSQLSVKKKMQTNNPEIVEVEDGTKVVPGTSMIITTLDKLVNWGRQGSIWPMTFGLA